MHRLAACRTRFCNVLNVLLGCCCRLRNLNFFFALFSPTCEHIKQHECAARSSHRCFCLQFRVRKTFLFRFVFYTLLCFLLLIFIFSAMDGNATQSIYMRYADKIRMDDTNDDRLISFHFHSVHFSRMINNNNKSLTWLRNIISFSFSKKRPEATTIKKSPQFSSTVRMRRTTFPFSHIQIMHMGQHLCER